MRKYTTAFGSLFNNISVTRKDSNGVELHREVVPVTQSKKSKFVTRLIQDANLDSKPAIKLPRIAYEYTAIQYAPNRKITSKRQIKKFTEPYEPATRVYNPVPYDIGFSVSIFSKTQEEMFQIIEQIVPFFTPDYTLRVKDITSVGGEFNLPVELLAVNPDDSYEGSFEDRRLIIWQLDFVMKGFFYGPIRDASIIYTARTEFINKCTGDPLETIQIKVNDVISLDNYLESITYEMFDGSTSNYKILFLRRGSNFSFDLVIKDADGVPINLTDFTVAATTRKELSSIDVHDFDITVADQSDPDLIGAVTLSMPDVTTQLLELGYGLFNITLDDGVSTNTILSGIVYVYNFAPGTDLEFNLTLPPVNNNIFNLVEVIS